MSKNNKSRIFAAVISAVSISVCFGCGRAVQRLEEIRDRVVQRQSQAGAESLRTNLALGNPSNATDDPADRTNYLLARDSSVISYNDDRGTANWAAWKISAEDLGDSLPRPDFRPDPELPLRFHPIVAADYSGSGFDRGHLVASADRFGNPAENEKTFYMTNIVPQTKELNQFPWQKLESYTRTLVRKGYDVYVIAGVWGDKGKIKKRVTIPAGCWKILYAVPRGSDPAAASHSAKVVAVEMPNEKGIRHDRWIKFKSTVRSIEQKTGYDFLSALPAGEQERLETRSE
jgi:endonuclease G